MNKRLLLLLFVLPFLSACDAFEKQQTYSQGDADFTRYVAIGNSLAAGFMNGELYETAQWVSFPYLISTQMAKAGGGKFSQPLMVDDTGFGNRIVFDVNADPPMKISGDAANAENKNNISAQGPFNNMGVPGATVGDLIEYTAGDLNSQRAQDYYKRFASNYGTKTIMEEVMEQNPTFVTLWIGGNDAMGFALRGGDLTGSEAQAITPPETFRVRYQAVVDSLNGTSGIAANIPDISVLPHFDMNNILKDILKIDLTAIELSEAQAQTANEKLAAYETTNGCSTGIKFVTGANPALIKDADSPCGIRQMTATDKVLLILLADYNNLSTEISENGLGWANSTGINPIEHKYILDEKETEKVTTAINAYNLIIADIIDNEGNNLHLLDIAAEMDKLKTGIPVGDAPTGFVFNTNYADGSFFSWDGVHPTGEGYAYIANQFTKAINQHFNSTLPEINVRTAAVP